MRALDKCWIGTAAVLAAGDRPVISKEAAAALRITRPLMESLSDGDRAMVLLAEILLYGNKLAKQEEENNETNLANKNHVAVGRKSVSKPVRSMDARRRKR